METEFYKTAAGKEVIAELLEFLPGRDMAKIFAERPEAKEEYDALGPQYEVICAEIKSRKTAGMTKKELAERMGTAQANLSRL